MVVMCSELMVLQLNVVSFVIANQIVFVKTVVLCEAIIQAELSEWLLNV